MSSAAQAYGTVSGQIATPRELEALTLLKAAARLRAVRDAWDEKKPELVTALQYNRKLWTIFLAAATGSESDLPVGIRQNIATLGVFVMNHTLAMLANPQRDQVECLININCQIAAGLRSK